ncbi:MAG TPA: flagellar protein FlaG [Burkholderiales bacterium]|nr:flagellar protein FlaG [Burkholderiales bacterium]
MLIQPLGNSTQSPAQPAAGSTAGTDRPAPAVVQSPGQTSQPVNVAKPSAQEVQRATDAINKALEQSDQSLRFSVDHDTGITVVKVVDSNTDEVIRQIPSDEVIAISRSIDRLQGILLKHKA